LTDYCNFSYSEHLLRSWVFLKPQTEGFGKVQLNVIFFSTISFPLRKPFFFPSRYYIIFLLFILQCLSNELFSVFAKKHYHNFFLFLLPPLTFSVYLYFYLLVPIQCIFIIVSLFLLSLSPPFPLLCPCSTSIEIRRKYFHLTREEQIERALCIKKVF